MDNPEFTDGLPKESNPFEKYGLAFNANGSIDGPNRPPLYAKTPELLLEGKENLSLALNKPFLERVFQGNRFSLSEDKEKLMDVVSKVFASATDKNLHDYLNFVFMSRPDWDKFKSKVKGNVPEGGDFDALHLGGLVVVGAEGDDKMLPLLFHESGHSLYPPTNDSFTDEFRAYYFQRITTEILHSQLQQLGLPYTYPDYYDDDMFPSKEHKDAYQSAAALYAYQSIPQLREQDNFGFNQRMQSLLSLVQPDLE